jgi:hypothetical protein
MPNDLSISDLSGPPASPVNIGNTGAAPGKLATTAASVQHTTPSPSSSPNPTLELNAALGLVVIEFRNAAGTVTSTIPTQQQLHAYQQWQDSGVGSPPNLSGSATGVVATPTSATSGGNSRSTLLDVGG